VTSYQLVETCCGSAALSLHLLGARRPLLPYQGGKWRYRHSLDDLVRQLGFHGLPEKLTLWDPGPWGTTMGVVLSPSSRRDVAQGLRALSEIDARTVFERLQGKRIPTDEIAFATEYLYLQRLSFSGKAVGIRDSCWSSPGFNVSSAYGLPGTERFGAVHPMIPSLIRVLEGYDTSLGTQAQITCKRTSAHAPASEVSRTLVYGDPPYRETTAYPNGALPRERVVALARDWHSAGAHVIVSEAEPIHALVEAGWETAQLYAGRQDSSPFRGKQAEWVTFTPAG